MAQSIPGTPNVSPPSGTPGFFDAHLDLAYIAELGRDLHAPLDDCRGKLLPAAVTLPSLRDAPVAACLATVFTEAVGPSGSMLGDDSSAEAASYPEGDALAARAAGLRQLKLYQSWVRAGAVASLRDATSKATPRLGVLIENADPVESPDALEEEWINDEAPLVAVGMTWHKPGRYAHGNSVTENLGITDLGRELVKRLDAHQIVHDVSHLNRKSFDELFDLAQGPIVATHSNCAALVDPENHRHLTDEQIKRLVDRGAVIGLNFLSKFLTNEDRRATIDDAVRHVEHVCEIAGHRNAVGLGTDMDGGVSRNALPEGIDLPERLPRLLDGLRDIGWSDNDLAGFAFGNWARVFNVTP
ncbi:MAG: membrane dipeptidase [Planctomycetota bacterium]